MRTFIAGHKGLVGSALVRNAPSSSDLLTIDRAELDLTNKIEVQKYLLRNKVDAVIVAAAKVGGIGANSAHQKDFLVENLALQNSLILAAQNANVPNLIFLGSSCIYPKLSAQPIKESFLMTGPLETTNEGYALAKICGIRLVKAIYEESNLNYFSLMPTNLYGPNDNFDLFSSHVPAALIRKFHEAKMKDDTNLSVWGSGKPKREFMHVDDMARACWHMLSQENIGGELFNVGTGSDVAISDFAELIAKVVGYEGSIFYDSSKPDGTPRKLLDVSKIHSFGWKHQIDLENGLIDTYEWFLSALKNGVVRGY
jgi:GDP-L-fucose synthase